MPPSLSLWLYSYLNRLLLFYEHNNQPTSKQDKLINEAIIKNPFRPIWSPKNSHVIILSVVRSLNFNILFVVGWINYFKIFLISHFPQQPLNKNCEKKIRNKKWLSKYLLYGQWAYRLCRCLVLMFCVSVRCSVFSIQYSPPVRLWYVIMLDLVNFLAITFKIFKVIKSKEFPMLCRKITQGQNGGQKSNISEILYP